MSILIKSYYRPYLLDRCLRSVYQKVNDANDFSIEYIFDLLKKNESSSFTDKWKKWSEGFKELYKESSNLVI